MAENQIYITQNAEETVAIAQTMASNFLLKQEYPLLLCLYGELGSGKTTFIQGFARALGINGRLLSPTFVLMRSYEFGQEHMFHHLDLYRLENMTELKTISFDELVTDDRNIVAIEWAERLGSNLPRKRIDIQFRVAEQGHEIEVYTVGGH